MPAVDPALPSTFISTTVCLNVVAFGAFVDKHIGADVVTLNP